MRRFRENAFEDRDTCKQAPDVYAIVKTNPSTNSQTSFSPLPYRPNRKKKKTILCSNKEFSNPMVNSCVRRRWAENMKKQ
jgi:hypothetical protein